VLVLLIRPRAQSEATARAIQRLGHRTLIDPVLEIRPVDFSMGELGEVAAVAVTSAHAVPALAAVPARLPVFAVGRATALAAERTLGRKVEVAAGDGRSLAQRIASTMPAAKGVILHLAGAETNPGLAEGLTAAGRRYRRRVVYDAVPTLGLAPATVQALREQRLDAVLLYSPRSARLWVERVRDSGLADRLATVRAVCLSEAVAAELGGSVFHGVHVAAEPDQDALLRCLEATR
jgi:uroporphyrinogen-III synthase